MLGSLDTASKRMNIGLKYKTDATFDRVSHPIPTIVKHDQQTFEKMSSLYVVLVQYNIENEKIKKTQAPTRKKKTVYDFIIRKLTSSSANNLKSVRLMI